MKKINSVIDFIFNENSLCYFYMNFIVEHNCTSEYIEDKNHFLEIFKMRYEYNLDEKKREIVGAKKLIQNLEKSKKKKIKVRIYSNDNNSITFYQDLKEKVVFGYILIKDNELMMKTV